VLVDAAVNSEYATSNGKTSGFVPCGSRNGVPWFCLITKPGEHTRALVNLRQQGFTAWLPEHEVVLANRQRRIEPLFGRYGFVQFDPSADAWGPILHTRGVAGLLKRPTGAPAQVPQTAIDVLLSQTAPNGVIYQTADLDAIREGSNCRLVAGPMAGLMGICKRRTQERVWLLMEIMGRQTEVEVKRPAVELA